MCGQRDCVEGVVPCPDCHGYGVVRPSGKRYTKRSNGKNITQWAKGCPECKGTSFRECGCQPLTEGDQMLVAGGVAA